MFENGSVPVGLKQNLSVEKNCSTSSPLDCFLVNFPVEVSVLSTSKCLCQMTINENTLVRLRKVHI